MSRTKLALKNLIGNRLRAIRTSQNISQEQLAARCQLFGWDVTRDTIAKIEGRKRLVSDYELVILCKVMSLGLVELLSTKDDISPFIPLRSY